MHGGDPAFMHGGSWSVCGGRVCMRGGGRSMGVTHACVGMGHAWWVTRAWHSGCTCVRCRHTAMKRLAITDIEDRGELFEALPEDKTNWLE